MVKILNYHSIRIHLYAKVQNFYMISITLFCQLAKQTSRQYKVVFFHPRLVITINIHMELLSGKCHACEITLLL
jgi:hypothetical protein